MDNKEMEKKELNLEEMDQVSGGTDTRERLDHDDLVEETRRFKQIIESTQRINEQVKRAQEIAQLPAEKL